MWAVKKVSFRNLMSFEEGEFEVEHGITTLVYGENKDNSGQESNGSGKSALLESIAIGLTGSPLRKVKNGEIVRDGEKSCDIEIILSNVVTKDTLKISRVIFLKKSALVEISLNGEIVSDLTSGNEANKWIEDKIGIEKEDLMNYFIISSTRFQNFLDSSDTSKKEVINRFSNGNLVDAAVEEVEDDLELAKEALLSSSGKVSVMDGKIDVVSDSIRESLLEEDDESEEEKLEELNRKRDLYNGKINEIKLSIKDFKLDKIKSQKKVNELKLQVDEAKKAVNSLSDKNDELGILQGDLSVSKADLEKVREEVIEIRKDVSKINVSLAGMIKCRKCGHEFITTDKDFDKDEAIKEMEDLKLDEKDAIEEGVEIAEEIKVIEQEISEIRKFIDEAKSILNEKVSEFNESNNNLSKLDSSIDNEEHQLKRYKEKIIDLDKVPEENEKFDQVEILRKKLASLQKDIEPLMEENKKNELMVSGLQEQLSLFKRFKGYLANKSIKSIEVLVNDYLEAIGSDITVQLSAQKVLATGSVRDKIDSVVLKDGIDVGSFNKNSGGERARTNLAFILAMNKLINLNAGDGRGLDLLIIDEILDSSDGSGLISMVRAMNDLSKTVLLVTHVALSFAYNNYLVVCKESGRSSIVVNK